MTVERGLVMVKGVPCITEHLAQHVHHGAFHHGSTVHIDHGANLHCGSVVAECVVVASAEQG